MCGLRIISLVLWIRKLRHTKMQVTCQRHQLVGSKSFPGSSVVICLQCRDLGWEDPLEEGIATLSSTLAWRIPWTEGLGSYSPWLLTESDRTEVTTV